MVPARSHRLRARSWEAGGKGLWRGHAGLAPRQRSWYGTKEVPAVETSAVPAWGHTWGQGRCPAGSSWT